jgi:DNA-binding XRE family transcriptional regulator
MASASDITAVTLGEALRHMQTHDPDFFKEAGIDPVALEIGVQIKQARLRAGFTQTQLAEASGVPQGAISDIERGKGKDGPSYRRVKARRSGRCLALSPRDGEPESAAQEGPVLHNVGNSGMLMLTDIVVGSGSLLAPVLRSILPELAMKVLATNIRAALLAAPGRGGASGAHGRSDLWELEAHGEAKVKVSEPSVVLIFDGPGSSPMTPSPRSNIARNWGFAPRAKAVS